MGQMVMEGEGFDNMESTGLQNPDLANLRKNDERKALITHLLIPPHPGQLRGPTKGKQTGWLVLSCYSLLLSCCAPWVSFRYLSPLSPCAARTPLARNLIRNSGFRKPLRLFVRAAFGNAATGGGINP